MHLPDGFVDVRTGLAAGALAIAGVGVALREAGRSLPRRKVPLMGLAAATVFAAQMINFPVAGGTSGHLLGAALTAVLLGPSAAVVVMTCVLVVQCLVFADGGITALGANVFNMAVVGSLGGWAIYAGLRRILPGPRGLLAAAAFAGWASTVLAALCCAGELALSHRAPAGLVFPAMTGIHVLIGLAEATITAVVLAAVARSRPELLTRDAAPRLRPAAVVLGLVVALGLALFVAPFAVGWPDGLEHVARQLGFASDAPPVIGAPLPGYGLPGVASPGLAAALAGAIGTLVAFALAVGLARTLAPAIAPALSSPPDAGP